MIDKDVLLGAVSCAYEAELVEYLRCRTEGEISADEFESYVRLAASNAEGRLRAYDIPLGEGAFDWLRTAEHG